MDEIGFIKDYLERYWNFRVVSRAYNVVENTHQIWLLLVCDLIIGKMEYPA